MLAIVYLDLNRKEWLLKQPKQQSYEEEPGEIVMEKTLDRWN